LQENAYENDGTGFTVYQHSLMLKTVTHNSITAVSVKASVNNF